MQRKNMIERKQNPEQKGRTILRNILITVGIMRAATIVCLALQHFSEADTHVPLLFVLAVVIVARFTEGYVYGILSAMAAVVLVNYVFTYPYFELNFSITGYPLTFVVMLATAVMVSALTTQIKWQEQIRLEVEKEKTRANLLRAVSHDIRTPMNGIIGMLALVLLTAGQLGLHMTSGSCAITRRAVAWCLGISAVLCACAVGLSGTEMPSVDRLRQNIKQTVHDLRYGGDTLLLCAMELSRAFVLWHAERRRRRMSIEERVRQSQKLIFKLISLWGIDAAFGWETSAMRTRCRRLSPESTSV